MPMASTSSNEAPPVKAQNEKELRAAFVQAFLRGALPGEDEGFGSQACQDAAAFALKAAQLRKPGEPAIKLESVTSDGQRHVRLVIINDDMPFLVDSIASVITSFGLGIARIIHPVVPVRRNADGQLLEICDTDDCSGERQESVIYMEIERADAKVRRLLKTALLNSLQDVRAAVADWSKMQEALAEDTENLADIEGAALLRWFLDRKLTQLAYLRCDRTGTISRELGIARSEDRHLLAKVSLEKAFGWFENGGRAPLILKSNLISTVHRRVPLDLFIVPVISGGRIEALSVHGGVWTSAALAESPGKIPVLRAHLATLMDKFGFDPGGHAGKALSHALTALPHDVLMGFDADDLERVALTAMSLADRPRPKLLTVKSALERHLFAFVWLPRDEVSTSRRLEIEQMLAQASNATILNRSLTMEDGEVALLRYALDLRKEGVVPDSEKLDRALKIMVRGWSPAVESELADLGEDSRAAALAARYAESFPQNYRITYGSAEAAKDIMRLRRLEKKGERASRLYRLANDADNQLRLKLYHLGGAIPLSDAVPVLENFGFDVLEEVPTPLAAGELGYIHDFRLHVRDAEKASALIDRASIIEEAISRVLRGHAEDDPFNQLIPATSLDQKSTVWLRAWFRYLRQTGLAYGMNTVVDALRDAPDITHALIDLFRANHDPEFASADQGERRETASKEALATIKTELTKVTAIDDDRLLRLFRSLIQAILRTNAFAPAAREALAFKIDSAKVPGLPAPLPWREVFVYSPAVEGIHLRAGPVARGGLRWSDRRDDFRTEVLGLMKAQRVKNAVIVPTGAKGGFFPKNLPNPQQDRDGWLAEGKAAYQVFIRTLLSITDNIVDGVVIHPKQVVIHDGEDPYFVVAADKGTASFSDVANAIAIERGFWLGDAFASGGSVGYDHKAMGITAKGAWLSVQRHFAEMGTDVQKDSITVAGCGDMSGDVFGNGMLLSKALKLVAAFDHRHIFIDPDPDPATSWAERQRLFDLPRSSWADYDKALISKGGGVFARDQKSIKLSPQMRDLLGTEEKQMEPGAIIQAILRAEVDLLWFGGIGTYIKAAYENNINVGDPANDALRINGAELGCRVIGEGANLGVTQAGRIEFAMNGGRINTDFIDNSAGVDCSDNEVNIKIALNEAMRAGLLDNEARVKLLSQMTDEVAEIVLEDNRLQALALSIAELGGVAAMPSYIRLIETFEESGRLNRAVEGIANNEDLNRRAQDEAGMTRPELAVLLSTAKLALQDAIEQSAIIHDPTMDPEILAAFPAEMRQDYQTQILQHQLRGELIATKLANRIINRLGLIHPFELAEEEGSSLGQVAAAFVAAERLFNMQVMWQQFDETEMPETTRLTLFERAADEVRTQMADLLRASQETTQPGKLVAQLQSGIDQLYAQTDELIAAEAKLQSARVIKELTEAGASKAQAEMVAHLVNMDGAVGLARLSAAKGTKPDVLTKAFSDLGAILGLDWTQVTAARMSPSDPWERLLVAGLARDFQQMRLEFLARAENTDPAAFVHSWSQDNLQRIKQFRKLVSRAQQAMTPSVPMMAQIASQARILLGR